MDTLDMNLLAALDVLLAEGSVVGAARRLGLSASAMSRTLTRLRAATGDPLLVRAGRGLVPTPRAMELRGRVHALSQEVRAMLSPQAPALDLPGLERTFVIRAGEGFLARFAVPLVQAVEAEAPLACLRFTPKPDKDSAPLREGAIDLEIGVVGEAAPELRKRLLFRDRFVAAVRAAHPLLDGGMTPECYAAARHVVVSRRGAGEGPIDDALTALGLRRRIVAVLPGFPDAIRLARLSDLVALVPHSCLDGPAGEGMRSFPLPVPTPEIAVSLVWHPRLDADPAHRWLRERVVEVCRTASGNSGTPIP